MGSINMHNKLTNTVTTLETPSDSDMKFKFPECCRQPSSSTSLPDRTIQVYTYKDQAVTITVGNPEHNPDFTTLGSALEYAASIRYTNETCKNFTNPDNVKKTFNSDKPSVTILLKTGWVMKEVIFIDNQNLSKIRIKTETETIISREAIQNIGKNAPTGKTWWMYAAFMLHKSKGPELEGRFTMDESGIVENSKINGWEHPEIVYMDNGSELTIVGGSKLKGGWYCIFISQSKLEASNVTFQANKYTVQNIRVDGNSNVRLTSSVFEGPEGGVQNYYNGWQSAHWLKNERCGLFLGLGQTNSYGMIFKNLEVGIVVAGFQTLSVTTFENISKWCFQYYCPFFISCNPKLVNTPESKFTNCGVGLNGPTVSGRGTIIGNKWS